MLMGVVWAIPRYSKGVLLIPVHWQRLWPKISLTNPLQSRFSVPSIPWSLRNGQKSFKMHGYHRIELWEPTAEISNHIQDPAFSDLCYAEVTRSLITESFCVGYSPSMPGTHSPWPNNRETKKGPFKVWGYKHSFSAAFGGRKILGFWDSQNEWFPM